MADNATKTVTTVLVMKTGRQILVLEVFGSVSSCLHYVCIILISLIYSFYQDIIYNSLYL